ncbi:MAG: ATP-binding protein [Candidatus Obscuribacterales bacterium]|nr:ATP-binding protein [Candidatus Obscuribacterales bacterium]
MSLFKKATKEKSKLRLALMGPSGSGKTFTALTFATALSAKIAVIDSERGSASKYADLFNFDTVDLETHSPQHYVTMLKEAEKAGYEVVIIDSLSHAWSGKDGALEQVDKAAKKSQSGNSFAAWREVTPQHNALVDAMLQSKCHVIATMRTKQEYVLEENERGRKVPKKVGMAPVQREGVEYEFDVICDLNLEHDMVVSKTRCHLVDGVVTRNPGKEFAETLKAWLDNGVAAVPKSQAESSGQSSSNADDARVAAQQEQSQTAPASSTPAPAGSGKANTQQSTTTKSANSGSSTASNAGASSASASQPDPKSTTGKSSGAGSDTTTPAGVEIVSKVQLQQLLQAATANGWTGQTVTGWLCHQFKLDIRQIETAFTVKQWEAAVKILSHPGNKGGRVLVDHRGQPLPESHHWPKA